jgi:hypothetical protein
MKISFLSTLASIALFLTCMTGSMHAAYGKAKAKFDAAQRELNDYLAKSAEDIEESDMALKKKLEGLIFTLKTEGQKARIPATILNKKVAESQKKLTQKMQTIKTFAETFPPEVMADIEEIKKSEDIIIKDVTGTFEENYAVLQELPEEGGYPQFSTTLDYKTIIEQVENLGEKFHTVNTTLEENRILWPVQKISTVESFFKNYGGKYYTLVIDKFMKQLFAYALDDESNLIGGVTEATWDVGGEKMAITGTVLSDASTEDTLNLLGILSSCYPEGDRIKVVTDPAQLNQKGYSSYNGQTFITTGKADLLIQTIGYARELLYFLIGVNDGYAYAQEMGQYFPGTDTLQGDVNDINTKLDMMKKNIVYYIDYANAIIQEADGLIQNIKKTDENATGVPLVYPDGTAADEVSFADYNTMVTAAIINPMDELYYAIFKYQNKVKDQDGDTIKFFEFNDNPVKELDSLDGFNQMIGAWVDIVNGWAPEEGGGGGEEGNPGEKSNEPEEENLEEMGSVGGGSLRSSSSSSVGS